MCGCKSQKNFLFFFHFSLRFLRLFYALSFSSASHSHFWKSCLCFVFLFLHAFLMISASVLRSLTSCALSPAALTVFTEPCMSFFSFVLFFTLILCRQADVFDGVDSRSDLSSFSLCTCPVLDVILCPSSSFHPDLSSSSVGLFKADVDISLLVFSSFFSLEATALLAAPPRAILAGWRSLIEFFSSFASPVLPLHFFPLSVVCFPFCHSDLWLMYPPVCAVTREATDPHPINTLPASRCPPVPLSQVSPAPTSSSGPSWAPSSSSPSSWL